VFYLKISPKPQIGGNIMKKFGKMVVVIMVIGITYLLSGCAEDPLRNVAEPGYTPDVSLCQVHMSFDYSYYEEAGGYIWDKVHIRNGQQNYVRVQMTFANTDEEALDTTIGGHGNVSRSIFIEQYEEIDIRVEYKNSHNDWVTCPDSPARIDL